jgi:hypothetical protein
VITRLAASTGLALLLAAPVAPAALRPGDVRAAPAPPLLFVDVSLEAGIDFVHTGLGDTDQMMGTGAAWVDVDRDGDLDLYVTRRVGDNALFINNNDGTFSERASAFGVLDGAHDGAGVAAADFDNDGWVDLFLANSNQDVLFRNNNGVSFDNVTSTAGLAGSVNARATSAAWGDYDRDGFLDLYVTNHVPVSPAYFNSPGARQDRLYHNEGGTHFTDVSNLFDPRDLEGYGFIGAWTDFDDDGDLDIFLVNDCPFGPQTTRIFRNDGGDDPLAWQFAEVSARMDANHCKAGMGIALGDYDRDGRMDYFYTDTRSPLLLHNETVRFQDATVSAGVDDFSAPGTGRDRWTWGANFLDYDLDGWLDLYVAAGAMRARSMNDPQANVLFHANGDARTFTDVSSVCGADDIDRSRTSVMADYDHDGDVDLFVVNYEARARLFRNENQNGNHFLAVEFRGVESNRDGIGARVRIRTPDGAFQYAETCSGSSVGGGDAPGAFFGLGPHQRVEEIRIRWPSGGIQVVDDVSADQRLVVDEAPNRPQTDVAAFGANLEAGRATLRWYTANETGNVGFDVEIAEADGYRRLAFAPGAGTSMRPVAYAYDAGPLAPGDYRFRIRQIADDGTATETPDAALSVRAPAASRLSVAYPNPFKPGTDLVVEVETDQTVRVDVYDTRGRRVAALFDGTVRAGVPQPITLDGRGLPSGVYFVRAKGRTFAASRKVTLLR